MIVGTRCFRLQQARVNIYPCLILKRTVTNDRFTSSYFHHVSTKKLIYRTIGQCFDENVEKHPNEFCYIFKNENKRYTFKSFQEEVDSLAKALMDLGFEKNDRFAVWLPNRSENVVMSYVASKLGLIKVNINPAYVAREFAYCINKVGCKGLLLSPSVKSIDSLSIFHSLAPEINEQSCSNPLNLKALPTLRHVIMTDNSKTSLASFHDYRHLIEQGSKISHQSLQERQRSVSPDSPVAIFYTSGTTGQPKAATLSNFNLINMVQNVRDHLGPYFHRLCVPIPMFHIFSEAVGVLNAALFKCQTTFPAILPDPLATMKAIDEDKCTAIIGAPIIFRDILNHPMRKKFNLSSLLYAGLGATPIHVDFLKEIETSFPIQRAAQLYGMTENAAILTSSLWAGDVDAQRRHSSLGLPMPHLEIKIADEQGNPVPIGEKGEICARGFPIMIGYFGDEDKTRETITESSWLRTGDQGTMDENGYLYYLGRRKEMIIRGGVNIYPIEIEKAINEHPNVSESQVFSIPDARHGEDVCAWIRLKSKDIICQADDIKTFLKDKLAFFKIPTHIRFVEQFPLTPTGKVQKFKMAETMKNKTNWIQ